jgi:hypothetical protein
MQSPVSGPSAPNFHPGDGKDNSFYLISSKLSNRYFIESVINQRRVGYILQVMLII